MIPTPKTFSLGRANAIWEVRNGINVILVTERAWYPVSQNEHLALASAHFSAISPKGVHDSFLEKTNDFCYSREVRKQNKSLCFFDVLFPNNEKSAPSPKAKNLYYPDNIQLFCGEHVSVTKKHWKHEGKMMPKRHPLNHQKVKETICFIIFQRRWQN